MATAVFSATFEIKDLFNDPQVKKALREREERYNGNMLWLNEDLDKKVKDAESRVRKRERVCGEEWRHRCLRDLPSLEGTLDSRITRSENMRLRRQLVPLHCGKFIPTKEERVEESREQKIWHCGHGIGWSGEKSKSVQNKHLLAAHDGLRDKTCSIFHADHQMEKKGNNTQRQYLRFMKDAVEGDIIFFHCTKFGGLTHFGVYTGETNDIPYMNYDGLPEIQTKISVDFWRPLSRSMNGTGRNSTLYEVKPGDKHYYTYRYFK